MIGKTVSHYRIISQLGVGGMGVVYKAEDLDLKVFRALKFLPPHAATDEDQLTRLKREARAAAALEHPNICQVHEIGHDEGQAFIVMSFLEGRTLEDRLADEGPIPISEALTIASEVGDALKRAHAAGIVHRDIKPANIMLTEGGQAVVMDFGLAKAVEFTRMTKTGTTLGTAAYMSPEQASGERVDARCDVWSLGVVLYEMLTGRLPFGGDNLAAMAYAIQHKEPDPVTKVVPGCSADLEKVIDRGLAKDPSQRYQTADELLGDIQAVGDEQDLALKTALYDHRKKLKRRKRFLAGAVAAAVLVAAVLIWWNRYQDLNRIDAIAVLPFANLSGDQDQEFFSDGLTDGLITELQKLTMGQVRVISRTSAMRFKDSELSLPEIAAELGVDAVVEASVAKTDDGVRVGANLIRARQERQIWADSFERRPEEFLALQAEIAGIIAEAIGLELSPEDRRRLETARNRTVDPQALELYLRARAMLGPMFGVEAYRAKRDVLQEAITIDSEFAEAYAELAVLYAGAAYFTLIPPREGLPPAKLMAEKALQLDPRSAEALLAKAEVAFYFDWNWEEPETIYRKAISLKPNDSGIRGQFALYLVHTGRFEEAIEQFVIAKDLDSSGDEVDFFTTGFVHLYDGRPEKTLELASRRPKDEPMYRVGFGNMAWAFSLLGRHEEAVAAVDSLAPALEMLTEAGLPSVFYWIIGRVYADAGMHGESRMMITRLQELSENQYIDPFYIAQIYERLGELDQAFTYLERAYELHSVGLIDLKLDLGHLAGDPRYQDLAGRMGIPLD